MLSRLRLFSKIPSISSISKIACISRSYSTTHLSQQEIQSRTLTLLSSFAKLAATAQQKPPLPESKFKTDLGLDSLDVVEVVMAVEEEFGLSIPDEIADGFECPADVIKYLESKLSH